jgi:hypothetical protein
MDLAAPDPELVPFALRAVKTVATVDGPLDATQRTAIALAQRLNLGTDVDVDALAPISPEELAAALPQVPAGRLRVVRAMVIVSLLRGDVSPAQAREVDRYAQALGVEEHAVENLRRLADGRIALLRFDVSRRSFTGTAAAQTVEAEGALRLLRQVAARAGLYDDAEEAARWEGLAAYAEGTLGRALWDYYQRNRFPVPGRRHALPAFAVVHDLCHVLSGYGVDPPGEIEVVSFQAGFMREDPMSTLLFVILQSHLGMRLVRIASSHVGGLDDPAILERAFRAFRRGSAVTVDLFDHWDFWPELAQPIDEVRRRLGIPQPDAQLGGK